MLNAEQFKGMADRGVAILLTWLVAKGYVGADSVALLTTVLVGIASLAYGWYVNRPKALVQGAATVPNTTVVTNSELANSTPETNIVSHANVQLVGVR